MKPKSVAAFVAVSSLAVTLAYPFVDRASAAPKPAQAAPPPVALAYDEIDRVVTAPATAPPPGSFQADYGALMAAVGGTTSASASTPATPTPAPHRRGLGGMIGSVLSGNVPTNDNQNETHNDNDDENEHMPSMPGMPGLNSLRALEAGRLTRLTFYTSRGWIREDDPVGQTASISKCNEHIYILLDLKKKTYRTSNTQIGACQTPQAQGGRREAAQAGAPGSVDMTVSATTQALGPRTLEGIATVGSSDALSMKMENATGSCQNASFTMTMVAYISQIGKPRAYCPLSRAPVAGIPGAQGSGGCQPRMHANAHGGALMHPDKLEMYVKTTMGAAEEGFANVLERGNVKFLSKTQADPLFEIPAGFTKVQ